MMPGISTVTGCPHVGIWPRHSSYPNFWIVLSVRVFACVFLSITVYGASFFTVSVNVR
jgi:hypothetical protein